MTPLKDIPLTPDLCEDELGCWWRVTIPSEAGLGHWTVPSGDRFKTLEEARANWEEFAGLNGLTWAWPERQTDLLTEEVRSE